MKNRNWSKAFFKAYKLAIVFFQRLIYSIPKNWWCAVLCLVTRKRKQARGNQAKQIRLLWTCTVQSTKESRSLGWLDCACAQHINFLCFVLLGCCLLVFFFFCNQTQSITPSIFWHVPIDGFTWKVRKNVRA